MKSTLEKIVKKVPLIVTDVDGVVVHDGKPIMKARRTLKALRQPLFKLNNKLFKHDYRQLPLIFLTNNCQFNLLEYEKAKILNEQFHLDQKTQQGLTELNVILNITPIKHYIQQHQDGIIMMTGYDKMEKYAKQWNFKNYVTLEEYATLFPKLVPIVHKNPEYTEQVKRRVMQRLPQLSESDFDWPFKIDALFVLGDCISWNEHIQIICDLLSSENGVIPKQKPLKAPSTTIPVYWANNSSLYKGRNNIPTIGSGLLKLGVDQAYRIMYGESVDSKIQLFGKPYRSSFQYAKLQGEMQTPYPIHKTYMIGDTIQTDINGANQFGWETILIRTGLHRRLIDNKREGNPAKYVVRDFEEAIKLIFSLEDLDYIY